MLQYRIISLIAAFAMATLGMLGTAAAGGYEYPGDGARAMGRGAASLARADDPMTMFINPAGLGSLAGTQFMLTGHLTFFKACIERLGPIQPDGTQPPLVYDPSYTGGDTGISQQKICNGDGKISKRLTLIPSFGVTFRASKKVGIGIGLHPPNSIQKMFWGTKSSTRLAAGEDQEIPGFVDAPSGSSVASGVVPSPGRYQLSKTM